MKLMGQNLLAAPPGHPRRPQRSRQHLLGGTTPTENRYQLNATSDAVPGAGCGRQRDDHRHLGKLKAVDCADERQRGAPSSRALPLENQTTSNFVYAGNSRFSPHLISSIPASSAEFRHASSNPNATNRSLALGLRL